MKNALYNILKTLTTMLFPVISFAYVSRIFLSEGIGKIEFTKSFISICTMFAMLGIQNYGIREASRVKNDKVKLTVLYKEIVAINLISAAIVYIAIFFLVTVVEKIKPYSDLILLYSLTIILTVVGTEWLYIALEEFKYVALRTAAVQIVSLLLVISCVKSSNDIYKYIIIQALSLGGAYFFNFVNSRKYIERGIRHRLNLKRHIVPIMRVFLVTIFISVFTAADTTMLGLLAGDSVTGLYAASYKITGVFVGLINSVTAIFIPKIAYLEENGEISKTKDIVTKTFKIALLLGIPITAGIFILSDNLLLILNGKDFAAADTCSKILSFRVILSCMNSIFVLNYFIPLRKDFKCIIVTGSAAILNIFLNFLLIPSLNQDGAAVATVAAELIEFILLNFFVSKSISLKKLYNGFWKIAVSLFFMIPASLFMCNFFDDLILKIVLCAGISAVIYFSMLLLLKCDSLIELIYMLRKNKKE